MKAPRAPDRRSGARGGMAAATGASLAFGPLVVDAPVDAPDLAAVAPVVVVDAAGEAVVEDAEEGPDLEAGPEAEDDPRVEDGPDVDDGPEAVVADAADGVGPAPVFAVPSLAGVSALVPADWETLAPVGPDGPADAPAAAAVPAAADAPAADDDPVPGAAAPVVDVEPAAPPGPVGPDAPLAGVAGASDAPAGVATSVAFRSSVVGLPFRRSFGSNAPVPPGPDFLSSVSDAMAVRSSVWIREGPFAAAMDV